MMKRLWIFFIWMFAFLSILSIRYATEGCASDDSFNRIQKKGELVIGLDDAFPPMGYRIADGSLVGFDIEAAEELGRRLGLKIVWQPTAWSGVIHALNSKKFDCIWNGMTITPEREKQLAFTKPYIMDGQIVVVRFNEKRFKDYNDLGKTVIGVQKGSSAIKAVEKLPNAPRKIKEYTDNPKALLDLESGRTDAVVIDNVASRFAISKRIGKFKILPGYISKEPFGIAFRKTDVQLLTVIQQTINQMVQDGTMSKISNKWFAEDITDPKKW